MDCKTKQMSSYQRLKWEMEKLYEDLKQEKEKTEIYNKALWEIANLKDFAIIAHARIIALDALYKTNETDKKKN